MPPDPLILGFDTSAAHCAAALVSGGRIVAERSEPMTRGQAERLMPLIEELLAELGAGWRDLAAFGVGTGPGNFTGVRVSVAAARGLALSLGVPAVGVTGFEALGFGQEDRGGVLVSIAALRGQVALWRAGSDPVLAAPDCVPGHWIGSGLDVIGAEAALIASATGGRTRQARASLAGAIALIAEARRHEPAPRPAPLYLRAADAAPPREAAPALIG